MRHAFLILTHIAPERIYAQVMLLQAPGHYFFIHFDKKQHISDTDPWYIKLRGTEHVHILQERVAIQWGSFQVVEATLALINAALQHRDTGYMHLLSGECLHVKPLSYLHSYFQEHNGKEFADHFPMPASAAHSLTRQRLDKYHLHSYFDPRSAALRDVALRQLNSLLRKAQRVLRLAGIYRRYPAGYPALYAGSQWWSLTYAACSYMAGYVREHPDFYNRFRHTQIPDEYFFHTLLMSSPFRENVINDNLRFINFVGITSSPAPCTLANIPDISKGQVLFARKFTPQSQGLLDWLKQHVYE